MRTAPTAYCEKCGRKRQIAEPCRWCAEADKKLARIKAGEVERRFSTGGTGVDLSERIARAGPQRSVAEVTEARRRGGW
jgi:hypothetical protein